MFSPPPSGKFFINFTLTEIDRYTFLKLIGNFSQFGIKGETLFIRYNAPSVVWAIPTSLLNELFNINKLLIINVCLLHYEER